MLPTKFGVSWPLGSGEASGEAKNIFLRWQLRWPSWISEQNDFSYFDLLVTLMLPIKFKKSAFFSREEAKNRFSRWRPSWISHRNNFSHFYLQVAPMLPTKFNSICLSVQEKKLKIEFKYGGHLGFSI